MGICTCGPDGNVHAGSCWRRGQCARHQALHVERVHHERNDPREALEADGSNPFLHSQRVILLLPSLA